MQLLAGELATCASFSCSFFKPPLFFLFFFNGFVFLFCAQDCIFCCQTNETQLNKNEPVTLTGCIEGGTLATLNV